MKGENDLSEKLLKELTSDGQIYVIPAEAKGKYFIRFVISSLFTTSEDVERDWKIIQKKADKILN
jgi:hypothetical protein